MSENRELLKRLINKHDKRMLLMDTQYPYVTVDDVTQKPYRITPNTYYHYNDTAFNSCKYIGHIDNFYVHEVLNWNGAAANKKPEPEPSVVKLERAPNYKYEEDQVLEDIKNYIDSTYKKHYAAIDGIQATDAIISSGHGIGFCIGNIIKYAWRLGKKDGFNRDDVMKVIHYSIILLHAMKKEGK